MIPAGEWGGERQRGAEAPAVGLYLVEALVVERGHELCVGGRAVRAHHGERPFLLLPRRESVAEGGPLQAQTGVGQRSRDGGIMSVHLAVLHPGVGKQEAVAILLLVGQLQVDEGIAHVAAAAVDDFLASIDGIDDVQVGVGGSHLERDGLAVARELRVADVEPVVGLLGGRGVVEREHGERLLQRLATAHGVEGVASAGHCRYLHLVIGACGEPLAAVEAVAHLLRQLIARGVAQGETQGASLFKQHLFGQVGTEGQWLVAHGQRHGAGVGLTGLVGDVGGDHEVIEHGVARLGYHDRHGDGERAVVARHGLALGQHLVVAVAAYDHLVPVGVVGEPPVGAFAGDLVLHLRALHLHAAVGACGASDIDGVAVGVCCLHTGHLHLKRGTLVLLHAEAVAVGAVVLVVAPLANGLDGIDTGQTR